MEQAKEFSKTANQADFTLVACEDAKDVPVLSARNRQEDDTVSMVSEQFDSTPVKNCEADTASNEQDEQGYGKFKSLSELLKAYTSLESEFTKRSQKLKDLEQKVNEQPSAQKEQSAQPQKTAQNQEVQNEYAQKPVAFLESDSQDQDPDSQFDEVQIPRLIGKGGGFSALPPHIPKTLKEAALMTEMLFRSR